MASSGGGWHGQASRFLRFAARPAPAGARPASMTARYILSSALYGYQSNDPECACMLAAVIYSAVAGLGLHYAEPPASFESRGQKWRDKFVAASPHPLSASLRQMAAD